MKYLASYENDWEIETFQWNQYMKCDGLPDPNSLSQMNTYLYLWTGDDSYNGIEATLEKTDEVLKVGSALYKMYSID